MAVSEEFIQVVFGKVKGRGGERHRHRYTYRVDAITWMRLHVGDTVVVPENWAFPMEQLATVVSLNRTGSDYDGPTQRIAGVVDRGDIGPARMFLSGPTPRTEELIKRVERLERFVGLGGPYRPEESRARRIRGGTQDPF